MNATPISPLEEEPIETDFNRPGEEHANELFEGRQDDFSIENGSEFDTDSTESELISYPPEWVRRGGSTSTDVSELDEQREFFTSPIGIVMVILVLLQLNILIWNDICSRSKKNRAVDVFMELLR